jgi:hypothetical protein
MGTFWGFFERLTTFPQRFAKGQDFVGFFWGDQTTERLLFLMMMIVLVY